MRKLKEISESAYNDFVLREPKSFCKSLICHFTKTDMIENNICESFNIYIIRYRDKPIIDMLEGIRQKLMTRMPEMVRKLSTSSDTLCPRVNVKIGKFQKLIQSRGCVVKLSMENNFEIHCSDEIVIVRLNEKFCSCKMWALTGIPCFHALACIRYNTEDPIHYVGQFYHRSNYLAAYNHYLSPIYGPKDWPSVEGPPILPPSFVRQPGRLKKNRRRALHEETSRSKGKLPNKGIKIACTKCRQLGNNKRSCREPELVQHGPLEQRARGRPRKNTSTALERRNLRQASSGFGVRTGQSGNLYVRMPGARNPTVIRQNEDVVGSQQSQVIDRSTPI